MTKQPNQDALNKGIDNLTARRQEAEFFETTSPWNTELCDLQHRFGTQRLAQYLSKELGKLITFRFVTLFSFFPLSLTPSKAPFHNYHDR